MVQPMAPLTGPQTVSAVSPIPPPEPPPPNVQLPFSWHDRLWMRFRADHISTSVDQILEGQDFILLASLNPYHETRQYLELFHLSFHPDNLLLTALLVIDWQNYPDLDVFHMLRWRF